MSWLLVSWFLVCWLLGLFLGLFLGLGFLGFWYKGKLSELLDSCCIFYGMFWVLLFTIGAKWLIKAWGHILIFCGHFWNFHHFNQIWTPGPRIYHRNTLKHTRKYQLICKIYYHFAYLPNHNFQVFGFLEKTGTEK